MPKSPSNPVDKAIGVRLKEIRTLRGVSQEALGAKLGVSFQQIQKYERGGNRIAVATALLICDALAISLDRLVGSTPEFDRPLQKASIEGAMALEDLPDAHLRAAAIGFIRQLGDYLKERPQ